MTLQQASAGTTQTRVVVAQGIPVAEDPQKTKKIARFLTGSSQKDLFQIKMMLRTAAAEKTPLMLRRWCAAAQRAGQADQA